MADETRIHSMILNAENDDFGFDAGTDEDFTRSSESFRSSFGQRHNSGEEDIIDADFEEIGQGGNGRAPDAVDGYIDALNQWEGGADFVNDASKVDKARALRLDLARQIAEDPTLISSPKLKNATRANGEKFNGDPRDYLRADIAYNDRPDPASLRYADFARNRARLRDTLFGDDVMVSAKDYEKLTQRTQGVMMQADRISEQYDLLDLRKEAALEQYDNPRFIAEVALASQGKDGTSGILDELLLDFDRKDLLSQSRNAKTSTRSDAMAEVFAEKVRGAVSKETGDKLSASKKISNFQEMREVGRNIRHDHLAIAKFAQGHSGKGGEAALGMGLAALENTTFSSGLYDRWISGLSKSEGLELHQKRSVVATFGVARKQFERDYDSRGPGVSESFAILEQAAAQILDNPDAERRLMKQGDIDDVAALHLFSQRYKNKSLGKVAASRVEEDVIAKMGDEITKVGRREGAADLKTEKGEAYRIDLSQVKSEDESKAPDDAKPDKAGSARGGDESKAPDDANPDKAVSGKGEAAAGAANKKDGVRIKVVDGSHIMISNSKEDAEAGKGAVLRLEGIMAPPEGSETGSGEMDAGLESKSHLEEIVNRHGVDSLGLKLKTLKSGETVLKARLSTGENLSQRMLRDGYALPVKDGDKGDRREYMTKQAEANRRGLWEYGFPEMDESWRREKDGPAMSWQDKKLRVADTTAAAMAASRKDVFRRLSNPETKLFALPLKKWSASSRIDNEIDKIIKKNPARVTAIYENNLEVLKDLRKRKDKLSKPEKVAHDRLTMGNRALASSLVSKNLLDAKLAEKNDHQFLSGGGLLLSMKGVRPMFGATAETVQQTVKAGKYGYSKVKNMGHGLVDLAMGE